MANTKNCLVCGEYIDRSDAQNAFGTFSQKWANKIDDTEKGWHTQKGVKIHLCERHANRVHSYIRQMILDRHYGKEVQ